MLRIFLSCCRTAAALCLLSTILCACGQAPDTDYAREIAEIQARIDTTGPQVASARLDPLRPIKRAYYLYVRASLTGDFEDFKAAETALQAAIDAGAQSVPPELYRARADLNFTLHRIDAAEDDLRILGEAGGTAARALAADIALQQGRYAEALAAYEALVREQPAWRNLARLAYLKSKIGEPEPADDLYSRAQEQLSAKEMRPYAWLELQRGLIDLDASRYEDALAHYRHADKAYTGYWLIEEHLAEVLDRLGRTEEAVRIYQRLVETTDRPDLVSALARIRARTDPEAAEALYDRARRGFERQLALYPEAAVGHFLEHLLLREPPDPRLLGYAHLNYRLRPNAESGFILARAYKRVGDTAQATVWLKEVAATPWRTAAIEAALKRAGFD